MSDYIVIVAENSSRIYSIYDKLSAKSKRIIPIFPEIESSCGLSIRISLKDFKKEEVCTFTDIKLFKVSYMKLQRRITPYVF